ncbi:MAG TPA: lactate racemase domain-containing protein [Planctomycetaceae bacterium]|jgi:nickel-dependent lactate racemase|nr:lactate racemase domain-containing protein [Planctomycetaceae bacterium]
MGAEPPILSESEVRDWFSREIPLSDFHGKRVLLIVPDATRTAPLPLLFDALCSRLADVAQRVQILIALGTHPPLTQEQITRLLGLNGQSSSRYPNLEVFNHDWNCDEALATLGSLSASETREISQGLLSLDVPVRINSRIRDCDVALVLGPVFPHEVAGFSGGNKYFFPGISGPELLNFFHWLGALITNVNIIGVADTPVRRVIDRAAAMIPAERRCVAFVVSPGGGVHGLSYGKPETAWRAAVDLSSLVHVRRVERPFQQVLSCAPPMYDELWVAGKCMYKLEPVVADGGELIIFAPHLKEISQTHGKLIEGIGYHVRDYFTKQWDQFKDVPWGVLAHSTHVRGTGTFENEVERPRIQVTLATGLPRELCERIGLGYRDPAVIDPEAFAGREDEGLLIVRKAGEQLYRLDAASESRRPRASHDTAADSVALGAPSASTNRGNL